MPVPGPLAASVIGCLAYHPGVSPSGRNGVGFRAGQALICTAGLQQGGRHLRRRLSRSHGYLWCLEGGLHMVRSQPSASWQLQLRATAAKPSGRREGPGHDISLPIKVSHWLFTGSLWLGQNSCASLPSPHTQGKCLSCGSCMQDLRELPWLFEGSFGLRSQTLAQDCPSGLLNPWYRGWMSYFPTQAPQPADPVMPRRPLCLRVWREGNKGRHSPSFSQSSPAL